MTGSHGHGLNGTAPVVGSLSYAAAATNGSNGASSSNGTSLYSYDAADGVEGYLPPEQAGQLETAAQVREAREAGGRLVCCACYSVALSMPVSMVSFVLVRTHHTPHALPRPAPPRPRNRHRRRKR